MPTTWRPSRFFSGRNAERPYAIVVLNQPVNNNAFSAIVKEALYLVCADAGADRLLALEATYSGHPTLRLPDAVVGDLDSIGPEAESYFRAKGVPVLRDPDQYSTDFSKSLKWIRQRCRETGREQDTLDVLVLGGLGGRVDQGFSQIHYLYTAEKDDQMLKGHIYLLSEQSLTFVLEDGENEILIESEIFEENAGIIPVMGPTRITTKGFEWDVDNWLTQIGGQLSTSNHVKSDTILVKVDGSRPLMTLELAKRFCMTS